jgi:hypothetical protein
MSPNQVHLALVHFPVVLPFVGLVLLAAGTLRSSAPLWRAALVTFVAAALLAWPVFVSGHETEEALEHSHAANESLVEEHEEAATAALVTVEILGLASLVALFFGRRSDRLKGWTTAGLAVVALAASATIGVAAHQGGKIRHFQSPGTAARAR